MAFPWLPTSFRHSLDQAFPAIRREKHQLREVSRAIPLAREVPPRLKPRLTTNPVMRDSNDASGSPKKTGAILLSAQIIVER
jgi:hypothetical protein